MNINITIIPVDDDPELSFYRTPVSITNKLNADISSDNSLKIKGSSVDGNIIAFYIRKLDNILDKFNLYYNFDDSDDMTEITDTDIDSDNNSGEITIYVPTDDLSQTVNFYIFFSPKSSYFNDLWKYFNAYSPRTWSSDELLRFRVIANSDISDTVRSDLSDYKDFELIVTEVDNDETYSASNIRGSNYSPSNVSSTSDSWQTAKGSYANDGEPDASGTVNYYDGGSQKGYFIQLNNGDSDFIGYAAKIVSSSSSYKPTGIAVYGSNAKSHFDNSVNSEAIELSNHNNSTEDYDDDDSIYISMRSLESLDQVNNADIYNYYRFVITNVKEETNDENRARIDTITYTSFITSSSNHSSDTIYDHLRIKDTNTLNSWKTDLKYKKSEPSTTTTKSYDVDGHEYLGEWIQFNHYKNSPFDDASNFGKKIDIISDVSNRRPKRITILVSNSDDIGDETNSTAELLFDGSSEDLVWVDGYISDLSDTVNYTRINLLDTDKLFCRIIILEILIYTTYNTFTEITYIRFNGEYEGLTPTNYWGPLNNFHKTYTRNYTGTMTEWYESDVYSTLQTIDSATVQNVLGDGATGTIAVKITNFNYENFYENESYDNHRGKIIFQMSTTTNDIGGSKTGFSIHISQQTNQSTGKDGAQTTIWFGYGNGKDSQSYRDEENGLLTNGKSYLIIYSWNTSSTNNGTKYYTIGSIYRIDEDEDEESYTHEDTTGIDEDDNSAMNFYKDLWTKIGDSYITLGGHNHPTSETDRLWFGEIDANPSSIYPSLRFDTEV